MRESFRTKEAPRIPVDLGLCVRDVRRDLSESYRSPSDPSFRIGWKYILGLLPYRVRLRTQREMMQKTFTSTAVKDFRQTQELNLERLLKSLLVGEDSFSDAVQL